MGFRTALALVVSLGLVSPAIAGDTVREFKCSKNVVNCLKKAFKICPKNVTFIADRSEKAGFSVLPRGTPIIEKNIRGRPTITFCTPK